MPAPAPATEHDRNILRRLFGELAQIAALPVHRERAELWRRLNTLQPVRPLVWINEIPWNELAEADPAGGLALGCADGYCKEVEGALRRTLYQWRNFPGDMVIDPAWYVPVVCGPASCYADYGLQVNFDHGQARAYHGLINTVEDIQRIQRPRVWVDHAETERRLALLREVADGIMPIERRGITHQWATPWDVLVQWYGIEKLYTDMYDEPELVHALLRHYMAIQISVLEEQQQLGLLEFGGVNVRVGSGGPGLCDAIPMPVAGQPARPQNQWGCGNAQIFSEVSPEMHWEFSLQYEQPYMERFALSYYGCCEPLHRKLGILRRIKNLRKVSMSAWIDVPAAVEAMGKDYVFSFKPNPAYLAGPSWQPEQARAYLKDVLEKTRGLPVEIILKDISTLCREPRRLREWTTMAQELAQDFPA